MSIEHGDCDVALLQRIIHQLQFREQVAVAVAFGETTGVRVAEVNEYCLSVWISAPEFDPTGERGDLVTRAGFAEVISVVMVPDETLERLLVMLLLREFFRLSEDLHQVGCLAGQQ